MSAVEAFAIVDLSFAYPEQRKDTLSHLSFSISQGQFVTRCGPSGTAFGFLVYIIDVKDM